MIRVFKTLKEFQVRESGKTLEVREFYSIYGDSGDKRSGNMRCSGFLEFRGEGTHLDLSEGISWRRNQQRSY